MGELEKLHPAVQVAGIVMGGLVVISIYLALFTDFWNNLGRRRK